MKIQIKSWLDGGVLFEGEFGSLKLAVEAAVKSGASLNLASLDGASLNRALLDGASLVGASLNRASLDGASLVGASLNRALLDGASLVGASLNRASLGGASLVGALLDGASLNRASLNRASLNGALLNRASLNRALLDGALLNRASLNRASLDGAKGINPHRCTPLLMLLDQPGKIRAYKLVTKDGVGPFNGGITYKSGKDYEVKDANTDISEQCAAGINLATLDWCIKEWKDGYRILIAEFTVKDIAAIPTANDGKFRVHRCRIVGEKDLVEIGLVEKKGGGK